MDSAIKTIAEEIAAKQPNPYHVARVLRSLKQDEVELNTVLRALEKATDELMSENSAKRADVISALLALNQRDAKGVNNVLRGFGWPIALISPEPIVDILTAMPAIQNVPEVPISQAEANKITSMAASALMDMEGVIDVQLPEAELTRSKNPDIILKKFLETARGLVVNDKVAVRVELKGVSKLKKLIHGASKDHFRMIVLGDRLLIYNKSVHDYLALFDQVPAIVVTSAQIEGRSVAMDKYVLGNPKVDFSGDNESVLAEFLAAAPIVLTQKTYEALDRKATATSETFRLKGPGLLYWFLQALAQKAQEQILQARAA